MATTTNYGWTTPDDTALVKDGASAIRTLGSSVDTTTKNLNPSTTLGDIEYRSSTSNTNTRVGIGSSGQALTVVAGVPSWAASATSTLTTTGDTLYASAANTLARRAIGSTGDVLTVSGGLPTWAAPSSGAYTTLASGSLSGTAVNLTSISQSYRDLVLVVSNAFVNVATSLSLRCNSYSTANHYFHALNYNSATVENSISQTLFRTDVAMPTTSSNWYNYYTFPDYTQAIAGKNILGVMRTPSTSQSQKRQFFGNIDTAAITSINILTENGTSTFSGGTYVLYGVK